MPTETSTEPGHVESSTSLDFEVRPAKSFSEVYSSFKLVHDQYCSVGYMRPRESSLRFYIRELFPSATVLVALSQGNVIGTVSGIRNTLAGVPSDKAFGRDCDAVISQKRVLEGSKLACSSSAAVVTNQMLKWLFHFCRHLHIDEWLALVNPHHQAYYEKKLGFVLMAMAEHCGHVRDHPGVLLKMDVAGIAAGRCALPRRARELFGEQSPVQQEHVRGAFGFSEDTVLLLLLEDPEILSEASARECALLRMHFSRAFELAQTLPSFRLNANAPFSLIQSFRWDLGLVGNDFVIPAARPKLFPLRAFLARLFAVLELRALTYGVDLLCRVDDEVVDSAMGDCELLGAFIVGLISDSLKRCLWGETLHVQVQPGEALPFINFIFLGKQFRHSEFILALAKRLGISMNATTDTQATRMICAVPLSLTSSVVPVIFDDETRARELSLFDRETSVRYLSVLIVEDFEVARRSTARTIERAGHSVVCVSSCEQALGALQEVGFDLVILDMQRASVSGFEFARNVRNSEKGRTAHLPILASTSILFQNYRLRCIEAGIDDVVCKGASEIVLLDAVQRLIKVSGAPRTRPHTVVNE